MKMILITLLMMATTSFANTEDCKGPGDVGSVCQQGEVRLNTYDKIIASPAFAEALAKANALVNGKKARIFYSSDRSNRMTADSLRVVVAGRIDDEKGAIFQKAEFTATSLAGGMYPASTSQIIVTGITQEDFFNFYN